jgi:hypothetical protein
MAWGRRTEPIARITTASASPRADIDHRQRRYVISMGIRTACFIGAVFARHVPWLCAILIIAAFVLPYVAVVMANSASPTLPGDPFEGPDHRHKELE